MPLVWFIDGLFISRSAPSWRIIQPKNRPWSQTMSTRLEDDPSVYKTLLESTKAIPWKIDWSTLTFAYIGPQIEELLGWEPSSWVGVQDWAARMH